jgi:hypothetical protein
LQQFIAEKKLEKEKMSSKVSMVKKSAGNFGDDLITNQVEDDWQEISGKPTPTIKIDNQTYDIMKFENKSDYQQDVDPYYDQNYY